MSLLEQGKILLSIARKTLELGKILDVEATSFSKEFGACFVSLKKNAQLRGCYGSVFPVRSLVEDVQFNTLQSAYKDPRFSPVQIEELSSICIELAILSTPHRIQYTSENMLLKTLRPEIDGVALCWKNHRATFLPSIWKQFPNKKDFLAALKQKAGLDPLFWTNDLEIFTYTTSTFSENL